MAYTYYNPFNTALNSAQMEENSKYICDYLMRKSGMTLNAICGMLGNWQSESTINPNRVESSQASRWDGWGNYGYGLAQWTPWYTRQRNGEWIDPANYHGSNNPTYGYWAIQRGATTNTTNGGTIGVMDTQLDYMILGLGGWRNSTSYYTMTWKQYMSSNWTANELARVYYRNYERSASASYGSRPANADRWYKYLYPIFGGGLPPDIGDKSKKGMSFILISKAVDLF